MKLSERQQQILNFIKTQQEKTGVNPSTREIQAHFGFSSQSTVMDHLNALERKGAIKRLRGLSRGVLVPREKPRTKLVELPLYGAIPAGMPTDVEQSPDSYIGVDSSLIGRRKPSRCYALRARGDSMINAGILDGDVVIFEKREPQRNDIVAALIDGEVTLKRFVLQRNKPYLKAENPKYRDLIPARELVIQGVMLALWRGPAGKN